MGKTCPASLKWWGLWPAKVFLVLVLLLLFVSSKLQKSIWLKEPGQDLCKTGRQCSVLWNLYFTHFFLSTHGAPFIHLFFSLVEHPPFHLLFPPMEHSPLHSSFLSTHGAPFTHLFFPPMKHPPFIFSFHLWSTHFIHFFLSTCEVPIPYFPPSFSNHPPLNVWTGTSCQVTKWWALCA